MINKLFGGLMSKMRRGMGMTPLEQMARSSGAPALFPPMGIAGMAPDAYNRKHQASMIKTMPGIMAAAARLGERPIGGKRPETPAFPLFGRRGT